MHVIRIRFFFYNKDVLSIIQILSNDIFIINQHINKKIQNFFNLNKNFSTNFTYFIFINSVYMIRLLW